MIPNWHLQKGTKNLTQSNYISEHKQHSTRVLLHACAPCSTSTQFENQGAVHAVFINLLMVFCCTSLLCDISTCVNTGRTTGLLPTTVSEQNKYWNIIDVIACRLEREHSTMWHHTVQVISPPENPAMRTSVCPMKSSDQWFNNKNWQITSESSIMRKCSCFFVHSKNIKHTKPYNDIKYKP